MKMHEAGDVNWDKFTLSAAFLAAASSLLEAFFSGAAFFSAAALALATITQVEWIC